MKVCFLSGKGGAGKTSLAASFIHVLREEGIKVSVADCDVECPNLHLLMGPEKKYVKSYEVSAGLKAKINKDKCINCGKCMSVCMFNAVEKMDNGFFVNRYCEGCFACSLVCPNNAIEKVEEKNGKVFITEKARFCDYLVWGSLKPGHSASGKLVVEVKRKAFEYIADVYIVDASAGIGCPVIASMKGCDLCFVVAEATPSGFSDFLKAIDLAHALNIPAKIVVNKADLSEKIKRKIEKVAKEREADVIGFLPFIEETICCISELKIPSLEIKKYREIAEKMLNSVKDNLR